MAATVPMQIERSSMIFLQIFVPSGNTLANVMRRPFGAAPIGSPRRKTQRAYHGRPNIQRGILNRLARFARSRANLPCGKGDRRLGRYGWARLMAASCGVAGATIERLVRDGRARDWGAPSGVGVRYGRLVWL